MNARRWTLAGVAWLCLFGGSFALAGAPAQAAIRHEYLSQESPEAYKPVNEVGSIAVDESTSLTDWAKGDVFEVIPGRGGGVVNVFEPEAGGERKLVAQLTGTSSSEPFAFLSDKVAVNDVNGDVIVNDYNGKHVLSIFEPTLFGEYALVGTVEPHNPQRDLEAFTVDESSGEIYAVDGESIDEFSSVGVYLSQVSETLAFGRVTSVTVEPVSHDIYVLDVGRSVVDIFGPDITVPDVTTGAISHLTGSSVTLAGTVNPDKAGVATCQFEWGTTTEFGHTAPCSQAQVAEGESPTPVEAQLSGLEPDSTYCYRLQATDANGTSPGEKSQDRCFTTLGPGPQPGTVSNATAESVTLNATLNPRGAPTKYYFQYGTTTSYGTDVPAASGAIVGSGEGNVEVSQHVQKLEAGTVYHYRVVELAEPEGKVEELDGLDQTFTTQRRGGTLTLADGRELELVTPPDKDGALFYGYQDQKRGPIQASAEGNAIADLADEPTEVEPQGYSNEVSVLSTRGGAGWSSQVIAPPHDQVTAVSLGGQGLEYRAFSEDLSHGIMQPIGNFVPLSPEATESTAYLRTDYLNGNVSELCGSSCYQPLVTGANTPQGTVFGEAVNGKCEVFSSKGIFCGPRFVDANPDLSHIIVSSPVALTSTPGSLEYEWSGGRLQPLGVLPAGEVGTLTVAGTEEATKQYEKESQKIGARRAISKDGERVILAGGNGRLYLRDIAKEETVRLDLPQGGSGSGAAAEYMTASSDDARIFFLDREHLMGESSASGQDLYEYDLNAPSGSRLTDLSIDGNGEESANVKSVIGASEDGSYVYFTAGGALAEGADHSACDHDGNFEVDTCNVYVRHDGVTRFVAAGGPEERMARVSPDGRWLAFMSDKDLTGYDTRDALSGRLDEEVYLYGVDANRLVCASCDPTGARPVGIEEPANSTRIVGENPRGVHRWVASSVPQWTHYDDVELLYQPRYLSDEGRLFFDSSDALVPQDIDGTEDVYEYEPAGIGSCGTSGVTFGERSDGCVNLISSGASSEESAFLDASETGGDVFFLTAAKLVSRDYDNGLDVYDAHECTIAVPCYPAERVSPPVCSTGDSCKSAPSPQPSIFGPTSSATFSGAGNIVAQEGLKPVVGKKSLTRSQKLARALKVCGKKSHRLRGRCERKADKRYGPAGKTGKATAKRKGGR